MKAAFDLDVLLSALVRTRLSERASEHFASLEAPFPVNSFTRLLVENALIREARGGSKPAAQGLRRWLNFWREGVFYDDGTDLAAAVAVARAWNLKRTVPPVASELMQPALAVAGGCTHFVSFNPFSRNRASEAGLAILPKSL